MEYYERLKEVRKKKQITQKEVANILQTTQQQINKYENGQQDMPVQRLKLLCEYYHTSADYILGLSPELAWPDQKPIRKIIREEQKIILEVNRRIK